MKSWNKIPDIIMKSLRNPYVIILQSAVIMKSDEIMRNQKS